MKKKVKILMTAFLITILIFPQSSFAAGRFDTPAKSAILTEFSTGTVLFEKDSDMALPPASITKLMTLLLCYEAVENGSANWDDQVYVSEKAWKAEGTRMFLEVGSKAPFRDIIKGISVQSANDGCIAVAEHISGSEESFAKLMNRRAAELGMTASTFKNSSGLPAEGHKMSARDIATLARYLITSYPEILEIESMTEYTYNNIVQYNRNPLLGEYDGADGLKTGWTNEAGYCIAGTAERDGMRLIAVVLNTKDDSERFDATVKILDYGFNNYKIVNAIKKGNLISTIPVAKGKQLEVELRAVSDLDVVVAINRIDDIVLEPSFVTEKLTAPVTEGTVAGKVAVMLDEVILAEEEIETIADVEKAGFFELLFRSIKEFFRNLFN
ncbi:MAG: D-alanyl-D-alanine carboxypeptidase [Eubacteriales bacterium]|nr:D-alanyl-D-alanine carboxypeptidase [Eubacteriales bacterium]